MRTPGEASGDIPRAREGTVDVTATAGPPRWALLQIRGPNVWRQKEAPFE